MILLRPVISEKSMGAAGKGKFTFAVAMDATKGTIKKAVEETFSVTVVAVTTSRVKGRTKRAGARRTESVLPSWKKATVTLKAGEKIDIFDVV